MAQVTKKQLTSFTQVTTGDTVICEANYGYEWELTIGEEYKVLRSEPNPFGMYRRDCLTVTTDNPNRTVTAHITRFSKIIELTKKGTN